MNETRNCQNCKQNFVIDNEDFAFYEKIKVPPPTFCPNCRMIRRFMFRSEHYLTRHKEEIEGKEIFAGVPRQSPYKIYDHDYWWSDKWDALTYGRDYDFSQPFFAQFKELLQAVPWCAKTTLNLLNSDYCDQASYLKNVYMGFDCDYTEDSGYVVNANHLKDCYDMLSSFESELGYEDVMAINSYRAFFSYNCEDCRDIWFSKNCSGCSDCFGCVNLKNKKYHIFNQPYSREIYLEKLKDRNLSSASGIKNALEEASVFWKKYPVKHLNGFRNYGSSGDYLNDTKNAKYSYIARGVENGKFLQLVSAGNTSNSYDYTVWGDSASQVYECLTCGQQVDFLRFCFDCWPACRNLEYCVSCRSSQNLFGCVGLRKKEYCIFNKQYTREEYTDLREKIIAQMKEMPYKDSYGLNYVYGEFFPPEFSAFSYNQTIAQDLFPLTKEEAIKKGHTWRDSDAREYETTISSGQLPDNIKDVPDEVVKEIVKCESCARAYRIIPVELSFYRKLSLPLPHKCWECRLSRRFALLNPPVYYSRECAKCGAQLETSYAPDKPEEIYCESCYNAEVA